MSLKPSLVQIAGMGLVTPLAWGREASWQQVLENKSATRQLSLSLSIECRDHRERMCTVGAIIPVEPEANIQRGFSRSQRALIWAIDEALADANFPLDSISPERIGCVIGSSKGDWECLNNSFACNYFASDIFARQFLMGWPHSLSTIVAHKFQIKGPTIAPVAACATGLLAIARGVELIQYGTCDAVIVGSVDCSIEPIYVSSFRRLGVLNEDFEHPESALKPFDQHRSGFVIGEGAGAIILLRKELAAVSTKNYGTWQAHHQLAEISDTVRMSPDSITIPKLLEMTLAKANLSSQQIDYINLHGTGTKLNDLTESTGVHKIFAGNEHYACNSFKGGLGHLLGAAGLVETVLSLLSMRDNVVAATTNCLEQDPLIKLPLVKQSKKSHDIQHLLKLSAGFGGHVIAGVISK